MKSALAAGKASWILVFSAAVAAAKAPPDIRYSTIVQAPVESVWKEISKPRNISKWLVREARDWVPDAGRTWRVVVGIDTEVTGEFGEVAAPTTLELLWPRPESRLSLRLKPLGGGLTLVVLTHGQWRAGGPQWKKHVEYLKDLWLAAFMRLNGLFPEPRLGDAQHRAAAEGLFVTRNLLVNGDFECRRKGAYKGVAYGWQPAAPRVAPGIHAVDRITTHESGASQRIAHPRDWTNHAVQQFTPFAHPLIEPGRRYRLTAWVRAKDLQNPAGWYKLGLWFTDRSGRPIGKALKNARPGAKGGPPGINHEWVHLSVEGTAPRRAARAVAILTGHWDDGGTVWYDDVRLWEVERPGGKTGGKSGNNPGAGPTDRKAGSARKASRPR